MQCHPRGELYAKYRSLLSSQLQPTALENLVVFVEKEEEADRRWREAGHGITACDYPEKLRCETTSAEAPARSLSEGLRGISLPFFNKQAIDDVMCRVGKQPAPVSPLEKCFTDLGLTISEQDINLKEAELRTEGILGVDRAMATQACRMQKATAGTSVGDGKKLYLAMEKEMQQLHFDELLAKGAANGQDFSKRFYRPPLDHAAHWEDAPHVEKCLVHGMQRNRQAIADQIEATAVEAVGDGEPTDESGDDTAPSFVFPRPPAGVTWGSAAGGDLQVLCAARLMRVALAYREFSGIVKVLQEQVDKQSVPVARLITRNRLFHAALWKHGAKREAVVLQVLNGALEAFDCRHLCPSYRDYMCERARHLCYVVLGPEHLDLDKLPVSAATGKKCGTTIEIGLLYRFLCNIDMREWFARKHGTWGCEGCFGTDDLENFFSELTRRAGGYMPTCEVAMQMAKKAEQAARSLWDPTWKQHISKRKRYVVQQRATRAQWNDGERVPTFWTLEQDIEYFLLERDLASLDRVPKQPVHAPKRMKREGDKQAADKTEAVRSLQKRMASTKRAAAGTQ